MADVKISQLPAGTAVSPAAEFPVNESGVTKKYTITQLISSQFTYNAGDNIGGNRAVTLDTSGYVQYASADDVTDVSGVIGITTGAATVGTNITVQTSGIMTEPSWTWTVGGLVFLGLTGNLTQDPTGLSYVLPVGIARSATQLLINIQPAILLAP